MNPRPGEVWMADLGFAAKFRPVIIVSRQDADPPRALVTYVPITTQNRGSSYEVLLPKTRFLSKDPLRTCKGSRLCRPLASAEGLDRFLGKASPRSNRPSPGPRNWKSVPRRPRRRTVEPDRSGMAARTHLIPLAGPLHRRAWTIAGRRGAGAAELSPDLLKVIHKQVVSLPARVFAGRQQVEQGQAEH